MMYMSLPTIVILALASIFLLVAFVSYFMRRRGDATFIFFAISGMCFYLFFMTATH
jgi:hypothetical protein